MANSKKPSNSEKFQRVRENVDKGQGEHNSKGYGILKNLGKLPK